MLRSLDTGMAMVDVEFHSMMLDMGEDEIESD
jgi:hypothetical protein